MVWKGRLKSPLSDSHSSDNQLSYAADLEKGTAILQSSRIVFRRIKAHLRMNMLRSKTAVSQIGKQCKPVQVHSFLKFSLAVKNQKLLVGATSPIPFEHHLR